MIPFEHFAKLELRVAKILSAERVPNSEKLIKLRVSLGGEERQIIAGIGRAYDQDSLTGREIVIVANLEPRMLVGLESQGMLLAANDGGTPVLIEPEHEVPPGTNIQ